ncbi:MAG: ABC transporter substrate-binding protein [Pseudomonadota bacterium]|nr:ABC transporter substrate-binding protein [Pseudomonadota bacterium]
MPLRLLVAVALALVAGEATAASNGYADPGKVLRVALPVAETGFDPYAVSDLYSGHVIRGIFDTLYEYDYLARPYRLIPSLATSLPEVSDGGRTWTIRLRPGVYFADDAAFKGKPREVTAADVVYSWKRLLDPRVRSPYQWFLDRKLMGAEPVLERARQSGRLDYDATIEGLQALDRYTLRIKLTEPDYILQGYMSHYAMSIVAREVIEAYGDASGWAMANPVGSGPYRLAQWRRGQQIVLEANPGYRDRRFPDKGEAADADILRRMRGKRLPQIGRIEISVIEESNPRLLAFNSRGLDYANVPPELTDTVLERDGSLKRSYASEGVHVQRVTQPALQYAYFNMEDPVVGGYARDRIALRRAMVMGFDIAGLIRTVYQGQAIPATQPIPPNVPGHDAHFDARLKHDAAAARALLDKFGYVDRDGDGWRELPDGRPLIVTMGSATSGREREIDELWKRSMTAIGIRLEFLKQKWPDLLKMGRAGQLQMWRVGWITQYAEGDAFAQLLYGRNVGQSNLARFNLPEYDSLYSESRALPDGPRRSALYRKMSEIVAAYNPWELGVYTIENTVVHRNVIGYRKHAYWEHPWLFLDLDVASVHQSR